MSGPLIYTRGSTIQVIDEAPPPPPPPPPPGSWPFTVPAAGHIGTISTNTLNALHTDPNELFALSKVLGAWSSAQVVKVSAADFLYVIFGGGHGDTGYDGVLAFRGSTGLFEKMLAPTHTTPAMVADQVHGETIANRPESQHTYDNLQPLHFDDAQGAALLQVRGSAVGQGAAISGQAHRFNTTTKQWSRYGNVNAASPYTTCWITVKDTTRKRIAVYPSNNWNNFYTLDYSQASPTWQAASQGFRPNWSDSYPAFGVYDPVRDWDIVGTNHNGLGLHYLPSAVRTGTFAPLSLTGMPLPDVYCLGLQYRSANDTFLLPDTVTPPGVFVLTPSTSGPWTVSRIAMQGSTAFANNVSAPQWCNRFQYSDQLDALLVCPSPGSPMECWKL